MEEKDANALGQEVAAVDRLPVHCTVRMTEFLKRHAPWSGVVEAGHIVLHAHDPGEVGAVEFEPLPGLKVEAVRVPHRDDYSDTVAFKVRGPSQTLLWAPDVDQWGRHEDLLDGLLADVDLAYLDATFFPLLRDELLREERSLLRDDWPNFPNRSSSR